MKKIFLLAILFFAVASTFAQCTITGKSTLNVLDEETFSVVSGFAQCQECHLWTTLGSSATLSGDVKTNTVKLSASQGGQQILTVTVLTPQGVSQCSKNIDVLDGEKNSASNSDPAAAASSASRMANCDIQVTNYREVKYSENIVTFFPDINTADYRYHWTATYASGESMQSTEKVPQFPFTKEKSINRVRLRITSPKCMREFSKTYDANYWRWF